MKIDKIMLRGAFGRFPTGVCVVSAKSNDADAPIGMTVNSFTSISLDPPLVLWSIQNSSDCYMSFSEADLYAISILSSDQKAVANQYSKKNNHVLDDDIFSLGELGLPIIKDSLCSFECEIRDKYLCGDHTIIIGEVKNIVLKDTGEALIFSSGKFLQ
jgi:flavin reductase (DIM6/NTAB) family NADH-FMN oxidoreductase RutF